MNRIVEIHHGTPLTPRAALIDVLSGRDACVSFARPDDVDAVEAVCRKIMYDNGAFRFWQLSMREGREWDDGPRDWSDYYRWLERRLNPGRWAVIPDIPGAPSQLNDALLLGWPFGRSYGVPLWHMDGPLIRLGRLCDRYDKVALGWIGHLKKEPVGCPRYRARMDEVDSLFGNNWPSIHMMRGILVAHDYNFSSADATTLAQNGHRYDDYDELFGKKWWGRSAYADHLERPRRRWSPSLQPDLFEE